MEKLVYLVENKQIGKRKTCWWHVKAGKSHIISDDMRLQKYNSYCLIWGGFTQETGPRDLGEVPDEKQTNKGVRIYNLE